MTTKWTLRYDRMDDGVEVGVHCTRLSNYDVILFFGRHLCLHVS